MGGQSTALQPAQLDKLPRQLDPQHEVMPLVISQPRYVRGLSRGYTKVKVVVIVEKPLEAAKNRCARNRLAALLPCSSAAVQCSAGQQ